MSRFFPHPPYAEDQPLSHTILVSHSLHRGFQAGAVVTLAARVGWLSVQSLRAGSGIGPVLSSAGWPVLQRSVGVGSLVGTAILTAGVYGRMRGRQEIEWQDRSWRLLENRGQVLVDDFSLVGTASALAYTAVRRPSSTSAVPLGWKMVVGRAALGNIAGVVGYLAWVNTFGYQKQS